MGNSQGKINIVFLTDSLADLMGGAERQIYELAKALDKEKYDVTIASLESVGQAPGHLIEEIGCHFIGFPVKRIYGLSGFVQGLRFWRFLKREKVHILQTYHFGSDIWGAVLARLANVKFIISNRRDMGFWRLPRHVTAYKWVNRWVYRIVVVSESIKRLVMSEEDVNEKEIEVIYNGVHLPVSTDRLEVLKYRKKFGINEKDLVMMHVANLTAVKGHEYLLKAMAQVVQECHEAKLILIGEGELRERLCELAEQLNLADHVIFAGKIENARQLLVMADICVLPSMSEGMSNSILEYMASGKPVIVTRVGGNPELIENGKNGILVEKGDVTQLKEAILELIHDPTKRTLMGENGLGKIKEKFAMSDMICKYTDLFEQTLSQRKQVLHLVSSGGLFGAERVILNIAECSDSVESFVGAFNNRHNPHLEIIEEAKRKGLKTVIFHSRGRVDFRTIFQIKKFLSENDIDVLHTHNYKSDIVGFFAALFSRKKWVATNHVWHGLNRKVRFYEKVDAFVLRFAKKVVAVSSEIKDDLVSKNISAEKVHVIGNGIDISRFERFPPAEMLKDELGIDKNDYVVTMVGRLSPEKGHKVFLAAAKEVLRQVHNVKFLIVGDGPIRQDLCGQARQLNLNGNVVFAGIREDMPAVYALSDLMVNASSIEGLPMTILEAMASRVALIVTPVGAVPEVIDDGVNGIVTQVNDDKGLVKAICLLMNDPDRRNILVDRAYRDVCDRFSASAMAAKYDKIYENIV